MCIIPTVRPTKRVSTDGSAEYQDIVHPMKSRYRALSSYGPHALLGRVMAGMPHEVVGDQLGPPLERVEQGERPIGSGQFLAVDRPNLLSMTWTNSDWADPTAQSVANIAFEPYDDDQTLMSIEHSLLPPEDFEHFSRGWATVCDQFFAVLQGRQSTG